MSHVFPRHTHKQVPAAGTMDGAGRGGDGGGGADGRRKQQQQQQQQQPASSGVEGASYPMYPFAMVYQTTNPHQHQAAMTLYGTMGMTAGVDGGGGSGGGGSSSMAYYASQQQQQEAFLGHGGVGGINFYNDAGMKSSEGLEALVAAQEAADPPSLVPQPIFVNPKQYERIMKRREARARLENHRKVVAERKPFLHKSRHEHAIKRPRGPGGRFLTKEERIAWDEEQARLDAAAAAAGGGGGGGGGGEEGEEQRRPHKTARMSNTPGVTLAPQPTGRYPPVSRQQQQQQHPSQALFSSSSSSSSSSSRGAKKEKDQSSRR